MENNKKCVAFFETKYMVVKKVNMRMLKIDGIAI